MSDTAPEPEQDAPEPDSAPVPAAGQITVSANVKVRDLLVGVPTVVADDEEWRALAASGLVEILG